jgi:hypothetical protein
MTVSCVVVIEEVDVKNELEQLDLAVDPLRDVVRHIALTINSYTEDHPSWGPGITTASEAVFALRSILRSLGWRREEENGFALTVHPENRLAINIAKGDEGVGDANSQVLSVSAKGICTEVAIEQNQMCFGFVKRVEITVLDSMGRPTWYLLYNKKANGIHAELSLPLELADSRQLSGWAKRIILPITRIDGEGEVTAGFEDSGFEVNVKRKIV